MPVSPGLLTTPLSVHGVGEKKQIGPVSPCKTLASVITIISVGASPPKKGINFFLKFFKPFTYINLAKTKHR